MKATPFLHLSCCAGWPCFTWRSLRLLSRPWRRGSAWIPQISSISRGLESAKRSLTVSVCLILIQIWDPRSCSLPNVFPICILSSYPILQMRTMVPRLQPVWQVNNLLLPHPRLPRPLPRPPIPLPLSPWLRRWQPSLSLRGNTGKGMPLPHLYTPINCVISRISSDELKIFIHQLCRHQYYQLQNRVTVDIYAKVWEGQWVQILRAAHLCPLPP